MIELIRTLPSYIALLWQTIGQALRLDPIFMGASEAGPIPFSVMLGIAILGGISLLLGQSVILFVNRVRPTRFVASLLLNGVLYAGGLVVWAGAIRLTGRIIAGIEIPAIDAVRITFVSAAPMVLGFLILMPYIGPLVSRILSVWEFVIVYRLVAFHYQTDWWLVLLIVSIGWLVYVIVSNTIGWPIVALTRRVQKWVAGSNLDDSSSDILMQFGRLITPEQVYIADLGMATEATRAKEQQKDYHTA